ncbi:MAG: helix-turn-helix domain-containing protein [Bacteroidales bacterium]|nr:helix-turn-helix domain-containing protein [Bacteroidales bacterium]
MFDFKYILHQDILNPDAVTMLGDEFVVLDRPVFVSAGQYPYRNDWLIATLCEKGTASGTVNLREYRIGEGGFIFILPGQVIVNSAVSEDFQGKIVLMSKQFAQTLDISRTLSLTVRIEQRPYYQFQQAAIEIVQSYIASCKAMIRQNGDSQLTRDVLRLLSNAFFLGAAPLLSSREGGIGSYSKLTDDFLSLVEKDYRSHRQLGHYAERLGRSTKYLSRHIKEETGRNAIDWIERCVILDARAQLVSTKRTILEISDSLGFPSQSFFGKYFKRVTGMTPKELRLRQEVGA